MVSIKSDREIALMKEAGKIVALAFEEIEKNIKPGVSTLFLDSIAYDVITKNNAIPSFKGYNGFPGTICASVNEVVVHGIPSANKILKNGDIVSIDIGACYKGYHGDSARTFKVGNISDEDQLLLDVTQNALYEGLKQVKPNNTINDISKAIEDYVRQFGFGIVEDFTGHGLGRHLHEDPAIPNYGHTPNPTVLKKGMTLAIEPMINLGTKNVRILRDNWTTITADKKKSAHFEHSVVVTDDGYEILTKK